MGFGGHLCAGEWLGSLSSSNAFVTFYFPARALDLGSPRGNGHGVAVPPHAVLRHTESFLSCLKKDKILEAFLCQDGWRDCRQNEAAWRSK